MATPSALPSRESSLRPRPERRGLAFAAALAVVGAATLIAFLVDDYVSLTVIAMIYLMAVMLVAYRYSRTTSALAALLSVMGLNVFFVHPIGKLAVASTEHVVTLATLLGAALLISGLSARLRDISEQARQREQRARSLQRLAHVLAAADSEAAFTDKVVPELVQAFGEGVQLALIDAGRTLKQVTADGATDKPGGRHADALDYCTRSGQDIGPGTGRWDALPFVYLPLRAESGVHGALGVPAALLQRDDREHAQAVADLLAGALLRIRHAAEALDARGMADSQRLRSTLLAAVSHDFRTPLASIIGAASALQDQRDQLPVQDQASLLALIEDEALYLTAMTDNTLQWVRLSAESSALRMDWESVEEVVGATLGRVRRRDPDRRVQAKVQPGLPLVRADAVLLAQLLGNLLDNALQYSAGPVTLEAAVVEDRLQIDVLDRGPGIRDEELPRLFDTFYRGAAARGSRGAGLGLASGLAIAQAHGGTLTAHTRAGGGSVFRLRLPLHPVPQLPALVDAP